MRKSGLTGDEAYILSKHGETTEELGPLKKEIGLLKEDIDNLMIRRLPSSTQAILKKLILLIPMMERFKI